MRNISSIQGRPLPVMTELYRDRTGTTAVLTALAITVIAGFGGLAVDVGYWLSNQRSMQGAADEAAFSATKVAPQLANGNPSTEAKGVAATMGFVDGSNGVTVAVNNPPASGPNAGNSEAYEVIISQPQPMWLSSMIMTSAPTAAGRAVGKLTSGSSCLYTLDPTASGSLHVEGGDLLTTGCGVTVNSSSATAATINGTVTAPSFNIVGDYTGTVNSPKIKKGVAAARDPLAYVPAPAVGSTCDHTNYSVGSGSVTINPGVYCGGNGNAAINITGNATVTMNSGTYILKGGGLSMQNNATLIGNGVTLYNTGTSTTYAPINTQDNATLKLKAPTSGSLAGILFFQDRSINFATQANNIGMGNAGYVEGALYFPSTDLTMATGQNANAAYTIVVAKTVSVSINSFSVASNYSTLTDGSPIKQAMLAE
jgi:Flp pilus assembly protein TadG